MAIYVYCPRGSSGAYDLIKALGGVRLRKFDGLDFWNKAKRLNLEPGSTLICWGSTVPDIDGINVVNAMDAPLNKYEENLKLVKAGIPTINTAIMQRGGAPHDAYLKAGYLLRTFRHVGGFDLLNGTPHGDFYVMKETFAMEYRIHSFAGRSIRAGKKVPREGFTEVTAEAWRPNANLVHPWIRSFDGGWRIKYDEFKSTAEMRALAHSAIKAMGLTFGAVDIAQTPYGDLKVLEVNTAPGSDPNTTAAYARAIARLIKGGVDKDAEV